MDKKTAVKIHKDLYTQIRDISKAEGMTITWLIDRALSNYLKLKQRGGEDNE